MSAPSIQQILGPYSIASIKAWLKFKGLPHTADSRADVIKLVQTLVEKEKIALDTVVEGLIGIEEASGKAVYLLETSITPKVLAQVDARLESLGIPLSSERTPAVGVKPTPTLVYAISNDKELRIKWAEKQIRVVADKVNEHFKPTPETKVIVFTLDKKTGVGQLRYDKPTDKHSHLVEGRIRQHAYYDFYRQKIETLTGLTFTPKELRPALEKVLLTTPALVTPVSVDAISEDGGTSRLGHRKKGGDPRQTGNWKRAHQPNSPPQTYEASPMNWETEQSGGALTRPTYCSVDGANGTITFRAHCHEGELNYVLAHFV